MTEKGWLSEISGFLQKILKDEPAAQLAFCLGVLILVDKYVPIDLQVLDENKLGWIKVFFVASLSLAAGGKLVETFKHIKKQYEDGAPLRDRIEKLKRCSTEKKTVVLIGFLDGTCRVAVPAKNEMINELLADGILDNKGASIELNGYCKIDAALVKFLNQNPKDRDKILQRSELEEPARELMEAGNNDKKGRARRSDASWMGR